VKIQVYQSRNLSPRVDGKNGGSHCRFLFREDHAPQQQYDTFEAYLTEEQLAHVTKQSLKVLPQSVVDEIVGEFKK
jgi:hypothetical protein